MKLLRVKKQPAGVRRLKVVGGHRSQTRVLWEADVFPAAPKPAHVLLEHHEHPCGCSYCREPRRWWKPIELRLPEDKGKTSWRVLAIRIPRAMVYLRWTLVRWEPLDVAPEPPPAPQVRVHRFEVN